MNAINKNEVSMFKVGVVEGSAGIDIYLKDISHATSEEIAAGHRIDCEILDHPEDYTSPNCKKFNERVK